MWVCGSEGEEERESRLGIHVYTYILPNHVLGDLVLCIQLLQVFLLSLLVWRTNQSLNKLGHRVASEIHPPPSYPPSSFPPPLFYLPSLPHLPLPTWISSEIRVHQVVDNVVLANSLHLVSTLERRKRREG